MTCHVFVLRSQGISLLEFSAGTGGAAAPWIAQWLSNFHASLPFAVMSGFAVTAALMCLMLKETKGLQTAEVLEKAIENKGLCTID